MSDRGPDEWVHAAPDGAWRRPLLVRGSYKHAAPTELGGSCIACGYKHAAPTELGGPCGSCGYKLRRTPRAYGLAER